MDKSVSSRSDDLVKSWDSWRGLWRYALAVGAVGLAVVARLALSGVLGNGVAFVTFFPAVAVVGMVAGGRAGLLATVLSAAAADWMGMAPQRSFWVSSLADMVSLGLFVLAGALMSVTAEMLARARKREWQSTEWEKAADEIRRSEAAVRERAEELAAVMDSMPAFTFITQDREGRRMTSSRAACELLRVPYGANTSKGATVGERPEGFRVFKDRRELAPEELPVQQAAATGHEVRDFEMRLAFEDGTWRDICGNAVPLLDSRGQPRGAVGAFLDVTEPRRLERELRESEQKFKALFDNAKDVILILDLEGRFIDVNPEACERLGYSRE